MRRFIAAIAAAAAGCLFIPLTPSLHAQEARGTIQGRAIFTAIGSLLGQHIVKAGIDFEALDYTSARGVSGGNAFRETSDGSYFLDARREGDVDNRGFR